MAFVIKNRVQETTVTTGTGTVTLLGATQQHQAFSAIGNANTTCYLILSSDGVNWEVGIGTYTLSGTTLSRTTILDSSNSGSAISLVNTSLVSCTNPAQQAGTGGLFDQMFGATNGFAPIRTAGVWIGATPGGGGGTGLWGGLFSTLPTSAGTGFTTWAGQGSATVADTSAGVLLSCVTDSVNDKWHIRTQTSPATPYTKTALVSVNSLNTGGAIASVGVGWYDGTKAQLARLILQGSTNTPQLYVTNQTNLTTFSANPNGPLDATIGAMVWVQISDDGTNFTFKCSTDGVNFLTLLTGTKAGGFLGATGYSNLMWGIAPNGGTTTGTLMSWA